MPPRPPTRTRPHPARTKRPPTPQGPVRRSIYLGRELFTEIVALAKQEERKASDMIRILIRRGLIASRGTPPAPPP
jgi:hypothetical protein